MSTEHARLLRRNEGWIFEDQSSRNGSFLNGSPAHLATLRDGDVVQLGHTLFVFREDLPSFEGIADDVDGSELAQVPLGLTSLVPAEEVHLAALRSRAGSATPLLLVGEPGMAAELFARGIHALSGRSGPFIGISASALTGSRRFDGTLTTEPPATEVPLGGTLFVDEIGDLPAREQEGLVRLLREYEADPRAGTRLVVGTATDPAKLVAQGALTQPLFEALAPGLTTLRKLRGRREDLAFFVAHIVGPAIPTPSHPITFSPHAAMALYRYTWPLHVQELVSCLEAAVLLSGARTIANEHLPDAVIAALAGSVDDGSGSGPHRGTITVE